MKNHSGMLTIARNSRMITSFIMHDSHSFLPRRPPRPPVHPIEATTNVKPQEIITKPGRWQSGRPTDRRPLTINSWKPGPHSCSTFPAQAKRILTRAHCDDRRRLCRPGVRRLLRRVRHRRHRGGGRRAKLAALHEGRMPIYEPGLDKLVAENVAAGRLAFTGDLAAGRATAPRRSSSPSAPRRAAATATPTSPTSMPRRAGRPGDDRLCGDRHQIDRPGRHRPPHRRKSSAPRGPTWSSTSPPTPNSCARATPSATSCARTAW